MKNCCIYVFPDPRISLMTIHIQKLRKIIVILGFSFGGPFSLSYSWKSTVYMFFLPPKLVSISPFVFRCFKNISCSKSFSWSGSLSFLLFLLETCRRNLFFLPPGLVFFVLACIQKLQLYLALSFPMLALPLKI